MYTHTHKYTYMYVYIYIFITKKITFKSLKPFSWYKGGKQYVSLIFIFSYMLFNSLELGW